MARIKFGSLVTEGSGSLGGHTIQNSKGGPQWRTKPLPIGNPSAAQRRIRSFNPILQWGWRDLSEANRKIWNDFAPPGLSGHSIWMQLQFLYVEAQLPFQLNPAKAKFGPLGPELVINGGFDTDSNWSKTGGWTISQGKAHYPDISTGIIQQIIPIILNTNYRLSYDLSSINTFAQIRFWNSNISNIFAAPYDSFIYQTANSYVLFVTSIVTPINFRFYAYLGGSSFSLDNLSIKEIL